MPKSQNGYPANDVTLTDNLTIPGTDRTIRLRKGPTGALLRLFMAKFHAQVEDILGGVYDDWGYAARPIAGTNVLSNHASGTAVDINATRHPQYTRPSSTFTTQQLARIEQLLNEFDGCIRWGGHYAAGNLDPMHFEIDRSEASCAATLQRLLSTPPPATNTPDTPEETEPMIFPASNDNTLTVPTHKVKDQLWIFATMGDPFYIIEMFGVGDTIPNAPGGDIIARRSPNSDGIVGQIDSDRPGPIPVLEAGRCRGVTIRYRCRRDTVVDAV